METYLGMVQEAKVVVALDFGTTFSGFAYTLRAAPENIYTFYDWPMQAEGGGLPYCKTQTSLLYADSSATPNDDPFDLRDWGWPAFVKYKSSAMLASGADSAGHFLTLFKLHLATKNTSTSGDTIRSSAPSLPQGLTARRAIEDYLSQISKFILHEVRNKFGTHISLDDVQWCLTVPAIWDEHAKQEMRRCTEMAGLVQGAESKKPGGSPHPVKLFIEPEAASVYCQLKLKDQHSWNKGDKLLVVDCGGGTVDLVLHEKLASAPTLKVREVQESSGDLCGGSMVNDEFLRFLRRRIRCFERFERQNPATALVFRQDWEKIKYDFNGENGGLPLELPPKLATMWEEEEQNSSLVMGRLATSTESYDEVDLTNDDMRCIFDPVVTRILQLVEERMVPDLRAIMVVGGFSASPYLMRRMRETFGGRVGAIVSPPQPGSAVCCGAVTMGIRSDIVASRISKKTYGTLVVIPFIRGVHPESFKIVGDPGMFYCDNVFEKFVGKGDEVCIDVCVKELFVPISKTQTGIQISFYSSDCESITYVTDPHVKKEGSFTIPCPSYYSLGLVEPLVEVSMYFGRTEIQVTAIGKNFSSEMKGMLPVTFERDSVY